MTDSSSAHPLLDDYQLHGWMPDPNLSDDDNTMDLVMLLTRNSKCRQGHMACVITTAASSTEGTAAPTCTILDRLVAVANNTSVYKEKDSDVHAEMNALAYAAKWGRASDGCTAYITMPPCKRCFGVLLAAGISRIVTTKTIHEPISSIAKERGVDMVIMDASASTKRIMDKYIPKLDAGAIEAERALRKKEKQELKLAGKRKKPEPSSGESKE